MYYEQRGPSGVLRALRGVLSWIFWPVLVVVLVFAVQRYVVCPYTIPSGSMESTIEVGDSIWSEKVSYYFRDIEQGDIVTFDYEGRTLIKRVIAVAGQTIDLIDGTVYIDGEALTESYTNGKPTEPLETASGIEISYPYTVPDGYIWVMGDNRTNSSDSRYFGPIPVASVTGRAAMIYWPLDRIGVL